MLAHDNLEEFQDPANYDLEEANNILPHRAFYGELAEAVGAPVLEIACGTGLVTIAVARRGLGSPASIYLARCWSETIISVCRGR